MQTVSMIIREVHMGLWFLVVGYYFLLFIFLLFFRWRNSKHPFQFAMAVFFLLLAIGRCFYFVADYFVDPQSLPSDVPGLVPYLNPSGSEVVLGQWLGVGGFFQWLALATLSATAGFMIFGEKRFEIVFATPAVVIAFALAILPYSIVKEWASPIGIVYALFLPALFFYLTWQSGGVLRISNFLLGAGFLTMFAGQVIHSARFVMGSVGLMSYTVVGVLAPGMIVIGLILIATGLEWAQAP